MARPLREAAAGSASRLEASYALNRRSKGTEKDVLVADNGDAVSLGQRPKEEGGDGSIMTRRDDAIDCSSNDVPLEAKRCIAGKEGHRGPELVA